LIIRILPGRSLTKASSDERNTSDQGISNPCTQVSTAYLSTVGRKTSSTFWGGGPTTGFPASPRAQTGFVSSITTTQAMIPEPNRSMENSS
jgi:hypothetical protein